MEERRRLSFKELWHLGPHYLDFKLFVVQIGVEVRIGIRVRKNILGLAYDVRVQKLLTTPTFS